jgi:RNA polymerase sigma factor (sigma-70 family)
VSTPSGDAQRFEALYRTHYAAVARFVYRRTAPDGAEEVVAETFAVAWRRLEHVPADALPWLYVVARNLLYAERSAVERSRRAATGAAIAAATGPGRDPADAVGERERVLRAFAALSEQDREALRLIAWDGLSQRDAARVLGLTRVAFAMRVSRARRRLAVALAQTDADVEQAGVAYRTTISEGRA